MDYLTAVQQAYQTDVEEVLSEASSNNVDLRLKELRYGARCRVSLLRVPAHTQTNHEGSGTFTAPYIKYRTYIKWREAKK